MRRFLIGFALGIATSALAWWLPPGADSEWWLERDEIAVSKQVKPVPAPLTTEEVQQMARYLSHKDGVWITGIYATDPYALYSDGSGKACMG